MFDKIMRGVIALLGMLIGYGLVIGLKALEIITITNKGWLSLVVHLGVSLILELYFSISSKINSWRKEVNIIY